MNKDQAIGSFIGLAVGDALGTTLEFHKNPSPDRSTWHTEMTGGGAFGVPAGGWTDDTSMALALAESLYAFGYFKAEEVADNFVAWWLEGQFSWANKCIDIGNATREALNRQLQRQSGGNAYLGSTSHTDSGNGGIMRLAPTVLINHRNLSKAIEDSINQSRITHASEECCLYANLLARVLYAGDPFIDEVSDYVLSDDSVWQELKTWGYVKHTFHAAMWAARNSSSFEECVLLAVNLKGDADTMGAVAGQIAGAMYGYEAIPERWRNTLLWHDQLVTLASKLHDIGNSYIANSAIEDYVPFEPPVLGEVKVYPQPTKVAISDINMKRIGSMSGSFFASFDEQKIDEPFSFWINDEGKADVMLPTMASDGFAENKSAIEITPETLVTITELINDFLPNIEPMCHATGNRSLAKRTSPQDYADFYQRLKSNPVLEPEVY